MRWRPVACVVLGVTAVVTVHVITRPSRSTPGPAASERATSAVTLPLAPAASSGTSAAAPIEVDLERGAPSVTERRPTAPTLNEAAGSNR